MMNELIKELADLLYNRLISSEDGILTIDDLFDIHDQKAEYGLRKVSGGAIRILRDKSHVEQTTDKNGHMMFKFID